MGLKPLEERKAEFFAAMKRFNQLGTLLPKPESLDAADAAGVAEAEIVLAEMRKVQAELNAMMEYERKLRDLQRSQLEAIAEPMSAIGGKADIPFCAAHVCF
jgi:hypothetical protein